MISSYPSIYNLGHAAIQDLLKSYVLVEEKVDGSQFSFGVFEGELFARSKGAQIQLLAPEGMFTEAVEVIQSLKSQLKEGFVYRGEYLKKPKHNSLVYSRIPKNHIMLFDITPSIETYLSYEEKVLEAERLGFEVVPKIFEGELTDMLKFREFLELESVLGGQKIEGVVIKPAAYNLYGTDKKVLMGKFVSEAFKEVHNKEWSNNPDNKGKTDFLAFIAAEYNTQARWQKALIHLKEQGKIEDSPRDIGLMMKEIPEDILKECTEEIKEKLFKWAWPHIRRNISRGLPEWYKEELVKKQFENTASSSNGRTPDFDSGNGGSNPPEASCEK